jgi:hypothetical protein
MEAIKKWCAKFADEHPFALAWGIIIGVIAVVGRFNDIASWKEKFDWILQNGTHEDKGTHLVISSPFLFTVVFALVVTWIVWLLLYAQAVFLRKRDLSVRT